MKTILLWLILAMGPCIAFSQSKISKSYPVNKGQSIELRFDYPKLIKISSWDKNEISVEATVNINDGKNNDAFTLEEKTVDGKISISNKLDMEQIPQAYYLVINGIKTKFDSKEAMESYRKEKSLTNVTSIYQQKDVEISLEIKLPANVTADVSSIFGLVELQNYSGPIKVNSKYGGVDASLQEDVIGKITLTNQYGKIYTNLNLKPTEQTDRNFFTSITATPGKGPSYDISSAFGNIYLRKANK